MKDVKELYHGEIVLACHQLCQRVAEKQGLNYTNAEGFSLPYLEQMASAMAEALQECNPEKDIRVMEPATLTDEAKAEIIRQRNKKVTTPDHLAQYPITMKEAFVPSAEQIKTRGHVFVSAGDENDMLYMCATCGGAEGEIPTDCPGHPMNFHERRAVLEKLYDFRSGQWVKLDQSDPRLPLHQMPAEKPGQASIDLFSK